MGTLLPMKYYACKTLKKSYLFGGHQDPDPAYPCLDEYFYPPIRWPGFVFLIKKDG